MNGIGYVSGVRNPPVVLVLGWARGRSAWGPKTDTSHLRVVRGDSFDVRVACGGARVVAEETSDPVAGTRICARCVSKVPDWKERIRR